jgi:hypothetical protein
MAAVVADDEDTHTITHDSKEEVIREAFEVDPPQLALRKWYRPGRLAASSMKPRNSR